MTSSPANPTIVLVHGAWADGSSWAPVITALHDKGLKALAAPIPLTSLSDDIAALDHFLDAIPGPLVLGAHAFAGAVIAGTRNTRVQSLVFIAALAPDEGETVAEVFYRHEPHALAPKLAPDSRGQIWLPEESFGVAFAQIASPAQAALFAATQRPIAVASIQEPAPAPAWKKIPSWYLVAEDDRMIDVSTQRFMAERMGATIRSEPVDHTPLATAPQPVVDIILAAA